MAELLAVIGVTVLVLGIVGQGVKLSQTLDTYIAKVKYADKGIEGIPDDVQKTRWLSINLGPIEI